MEYERLMELAKGAAVLAVEARILGEDDAAYGLTEAGMTLERAAARAREVDVEAVATEQGIATD